MSTPRQPSRIPSYSAESTYYPRELVELDGILKIIKEDGSIVDLNTTANTAVKDSSGASIGTINPKSGGTLTIPDATNTKRGLVVYGTSTPNAAGTAAAGSANSVSRSDHTHPLQTTISGNAGSATKLAAKVKIGLSGVTATSQDFDGSAGITIPITAVPASIITGLHAVAKSGSYDDLDDTPTLATVATTGAYGDLIGAPDIPDASNTAAKAPAASASAGTSSNYARADHVHPLQTSVSGNAGSATKLATGVSIGLSGVTATAQTFDGSKAITIPITAVPASLITGLADVATSGSYDDLSDTPAIPVAASTVAKAPASSASAGSSSEYARADHVHPVQTSVSGNAGTATKLAAEVSIGLSGAVTATAQSFDGSSGITIPITALDGSKITGQIPLSAIPKGAQERLILVANDTARLALTSNDAQNGDVIKVTSTGIMYYIVDDTKMGTEDAFSVFTAGAASSVDWTGITNKPSFATIATSGKYSDLSGAPDLADVATSGDYADLTGTPSIPSASTTTPLVASGSGSVGTGTTWARSNHVHPVQTSVSGNAGTATKLAAGVSIGLSGVTATAQTFDGSKAITIPITAVPASLVTGLADVATSGSYDDLSDAPTLATVATSGAYSDLSGKPTIPTASTTTPLVAGTATYGSGTSYARSNHVHPVQTSVSGNAGTATKLANTISIGLSGVTATAQDFDGSDDIVIPITAVPASLVTGLATVATSGAYTDLSGRPSLATVATSGKYSDLTGTPSLAAVATSGSYDDLSDTPSIPTAYASVPKVASGSGSAGSSTYWSKGDHVHPVQTSVSGNAGTATKLAAEVSIGLSGVTATAQTFDGSKAITIPITAVPASLVTGLAAVATSGNYSDINNRPIASTTTPLVAASTAVVGTSTNYARADHVHPVQTSVSGNAGTATKLASGNTINGVTFTGASPITITANPTVNALSSSQNLNSLITQGMHYAAAGNSCTNKPTGVNGFGIIVYRTEYWAQLLTADNGLMYVRTANDTSGSSWDAWTPVYTGTNPPAHTTITTSADTTTTSTPSAGSTFTAIDTVTRDANGHVTTLRTKTITIPSNAKRGYGYGTCSTAASTTAKVATVSNYALTTGGYVTVRFTYAVPASATLNINSTGAKAIYNNGVAIKAGVINAGDTATFVYNGSYYYLVSTSTPSRTYTANITTTWTGSAAPYTQTITVSGMTANDNPVVDVVPDSTYATATSQIAEYGKIYKITTAANSITVYATEKTETTVPIQLKCVR